MQLLVCPLPSTLIWTIRSSTRVQKMVFLATKCFRPNRGECGFCISCFWWWENNFVCIFRPPLVRDCNSPHSCTHYLSLCFIQIQTNRLWLLVLSLVSLTFHHCCHILHQGDHQCTLAEQWLWICMRTWLVWKHGTLFQPRRYLLCFSKALLCEWVWLFRESEYTHIQYDGIVSLRRQYGIPVSVR